MNTRWRAAVVLGAVLALSVSFVPTVGAQKGGGLFPPGTYELSSAGADFSGSANNLQIGFFNITAGSETARPSGGSPTTTTQTMVFMFLFDYNTFTSTFVCATLDNPSDFTTNNRLASAALNTTLTPATPSCSGSPLATNITISAQWTGVGPLANSTGASNYACGEYTAESSGEGLDNTATANLALTIGTTTTFFSSSQTLLNSGNSRVAAQGAIDPGCGPTGFGSGPSPAGHFRFNGLFAGGFFGMPPDNQVTLFENNQSSQVGGGPATRSSEFDLDVSFFGGSIDGFGCFAISPSDVASNDLASAAVQTTIMSTTPICSNSYPGFGLDFPLSVSAAWTANGPVETVHDQNNYQCLGYNESTSTFVENTGADSTATVTMPDYFGNPQTLTLTGGFGSLTNVTQAIQANGVLQQACLIRE